MKRLNPYMLIIHCITSILVFCSTPTLVAAPSTIAISDTVAIDSTQRDIMDVLHHIIKPKNKHHTETKRAQKNVKLSLVPFVGYTLSTGFAAGISGVAAFFTTNEHRGNESVINFQALFDSYSQKTFISQSTIFSSLDQFRFATDVRWSKYPTVTYGLGNNASTARPDSIVYNYLRFYQTTQKKIIDNFYVGGGYCLDHHYNISQNSLVKPQTSPLYRYERNTINHSVSSGINLSLLFDTRKNLINPVAGGTYLNIFFRDNWPLLGSDSRWSSIQIDARKYFKFPKHSF